VLDDVDAVVSLVVSTPSLVLDDVVSPVDAALLASTLVLVGDVDAVDVSPLEPSPVAPSRLGSAHAAHNAIAIATCRIERTISEGRPRRTPRGHAAAAA
jgi:hypothetical protein